MDISYFFYLRDYPQTEYPATEIVKKANPFSNNLGRLFCLRVIFF